MKDCSAKFSIQPLGSLAFELTESYPKIYIRTKVYTRTLGGTFSAIHIRLHKLLFVPEVIFYPTAHGFPLDRASIIVLCFS
jgi:hypothetical protein